MWSSKHSVFKLADLITEHLPILAEVSALVFYHLRDFPTKGVPMYQPDRYPRNWQQLARASKERANWQCEVCHVKQGAERISQRTGAVYTVFLHAAHTILHDTSNPDPTLEALCPTCHGLHDWQLRKREEQVRYEQRKHQLLLALRK